MTKSLQPTYRNAIEAAIQVAERVAKGDAIAESVVRLAAKEADDAVDGIYELQDIEEANEAEFTIYACSHAILAAAFAAKSEENDLLDDASKALLAAEEASRAVPERISIAFAAAQADISLLVGLMARVPNILVGPIDPTESGPLGPLWPYGEPAYYRDVTENKKVNATGDRPSIAVIWDPSAVDAATYRKLVTLLGDLARAGGGDGVELVRSTGFGIPQGAGVRR